MIDAFSFLERLRLFLKVFNESLVLLLVVLYIARSSFKTRLLCIQGELELIQLLIFIVSDV